MSISPSEQARIEAEVEEMEEQIYDDPAWMAQVLGCSEELASSIIALDKKYRGPGPSPCSEAIDVCNAAYEMVKRYCGENVV